ncbi:MAG: SIR2 family protein [Nitrospirae bacterium]|nr:SIR2 family protein [Nitrospirota bacterium]
MKKKISVLLGAGSTLCASTRNNQGTPSTEELTTRMCQEQDMAKRIHDLLRSKYESVNFEDVLFALENLESYLFSKGSQRLLRSAQFDPVISAFTDLQTNIGIALDHQSISKARKTAIKNIFSRLVLFYQGLRNPDELYLKGLVKKLQKYFSLNVFTLNYDDLIDLVFDSWFDGFMEEQEGTAFSSFNGPEFLRRFDSEKNTLLHLHGSIRFGFNAPGQGRHINPGEIVKHHDPVAAMDSYIRTFSTEILVAGQIVSQDPIISGLNKLDKLSLNPTPFGYYYNAFTRSMVTVPNLLIIGYGARDPHINEWIREFCRVHGKDRKIVLVSLFKKDDIGKDLPIVNLSNDLMGIQNFQYHEMVRNVPNHFLEMGPCFRWVQSGFPFQSPEILDRIIKYFNQ